MSNKKKLNPELEKCVICGLKTGDTKLCDKHKIDKTRKNYISWLKKGVK